VATAVAVLAPFGLTLGAATTIGLARIEELHPGSTPFAWGLNGIMSVVASVLAVAVTISFGFRATTLVAFACYGLAPCDVLLGRWSGTAEAEGRAPVAGFEPARP
jgi:hypothetical protein